jgi:hypothetical protein
VVRYAATLKTVCLEDDVDEEDRVLDLSVASLTVSHGILLIARRDKRLADRRLGMRLSIRRNGLRYSSERSSVSR